MKTRSKVNPGCQRREGLTTFGGGLSPVTWLVVGGAEEESVQKSSSSHYSGLSCCFCNVVCVLVLSFQAYMTMARAQVW